LSMTAVSANMKLWTPRFDQFGTKLKTKTRTKGVL
jgi:hypothetical protein